MIDDRWCITRAHRTILISPPFYNETHSPEQAGAGAATQPMAAEVGTGDEGGRQIRMPYRDLTGPLEAESLLAAPR